jgi:hypothetical protein
MERMRNRKEFHTEVTEGSAEGTEGAGSPHLLKSGSTGKGACATANGAQVVCASGQVEFCATRTVEVRKARV